MKLEKILGDVKTVTEDEDFIQNFQIMISKNFTKAKTSTKPWSSSYWPLAKGTIADPYENSGLAYNLDIGWLDWESNYKALKKRRKKVHPKVNSFSQEELNNLAASEKYDILLGDKSFDLTHRLVEYMKGWGSAKENSFITKVLLIGEQTLEQAEEYVSKKYYPSVGDAFANSWNLKTTLTSVYARKLVEEGKFENVADAFPEALSMAKKEASNFVLEKKNSRMAAWEGICNGWSTGAGLVPRPRRMVSFKLPSGKKLNFYPSDIKGLVALFYVNSLIQDGAWVDPKTKLPSSEGTVSAGLRCNLKSVKKDIWGRKYDSKNDPFYGGRDPRCVGVHPAVWHLGLTNLIGKQDRSFVVERKVGPAVDNHPMYGYHMKFFNPNDKRNQKRLFDPSSKKSRRSFSDVVVKIDDKDQFKQFRNKKAVYIVGVENVITYLDYKRPNREKKDSEKEDDTVDKKMFYDLELDEDYNIVGGQWRAVKVGQPNDSSRGDSGQRLNHKQPDFFWTITKDYKKTTWFDDEDIAGAKWEDKTSLPPATWLPKALESHSFNYQMTTAIGNVPNCRMLDNRTGKYRKVFCEQSYNRPQPLINVVNALVELSK